MHSGDKKHYITNSDLVLLRRVLDAAGLADEAGFPGHERRDEAARLLIAFLEQGIRTENKLSEALRAGMAVSNPVAGRGYQTAREQFHAGPTPTVPTAGGYRYGRRIERNGTWTIYHVFSGAPAQYASWKMVGLNVKTAERALKILNAPASAYPST